LCFTSTHRGRYPVGVVGPPRLAHEVPRDDPHDPAKDGPADEGWLPEQAADGSVGARQRWSIGT
jgi:hypothetical protein